jgi:RalA-binding protein 1
MLALSKPQKWYESSYEDLASISPRAGRKGSDESVTPSESPPPSIVNTSSPTHTATPHAGHHTKGSKGRSGSQPPPVALTQVFGIQLEELFAREGGNVPYFLMRMIQYLEEKGLQEEGILRVSGSVGEINSLKEALQHGEDVDYSSHDPHAVAGLLKVFFRELPAPIIPEPYHSRILEVMFNQDMLDDQRVVEVKMILDQLPIPNRAILRMLMNFLVKVNCNADKNKMTIQNLVTCMVPTIKCVPGVFMYVIPNFDFVFDVE